MELAPLGVRVITANLSELNTYGTVILLNLLCS